MSPGSAVSPGSVVSPNINGLIGLLYSFTSVASPDRLSLIGRLFLLVRLLFQDS